MIYLPQTFRLFNQTWHIRAARMGEIDTDLGQCRPDQLEIVINPNQTGGSMAHTLLHEIVHSIEQKLQLNLTEQQVDLMALGLLDLIRSQQEFFSQFGDRNGE